MHNTESESSELPVRPPSRWWKCLGPTSTERPATAGNSFLPLVFGLTDPAKRRNPRDPIPGSSWEESALEHGRASDVPVSGPRSRQEGRLARRHLHNRPATPLELPGTDWGSDPPPTGNERERESSEWMTAMSIGYDLGKQDRPSSESVRVDIFKTSEECNIFT